MLSQHQSWCEQQLQQFWMASVTITLYWRLRRSDKLPGRISQHFLNVLYLLYFTGWNVFFVCFALFLLIRYVHALASCSKTMSWYFGQLYPTSYQPLLRSFSLCWTKRLPEETNSREEIAFKCAKKMERFSLLLRQK